MNDDEMELVGRIDTILSVKMKLNSHGAFTSPCLRHVDATCLPCRVKGGDSLQGMFGQRSIPIRFLPPLPSGFPIIRLYRDPLKNHPILPNWKIDDRVDTLNILHNITGRRDRETSRESLPN